MLQDTTDRVLWSLLAVTIVAAAVLLATGPRRADAGKGGGVDKAVERQIAYQARAALIQKLYAPVEQLRAEGQLQTALLKLDELTKQYPGEPHGSILQGEILRQMGVFDQAVASFVRGVTLSGDYVDARSPLSRRSEIEQVVNQGLQGLKGLKAEYSDRKAAALQKNLFYLQSRLAGGCE